jgi:hypothetical protein|tara:strand:- start:119 stop:505 length:387 start_codon:yes stop_codon:yes gene_type:complete
MAYVSQEMKKELAPAIKAVLKKYRMKGSIAVNNHSTLEVNLSEGYVDCISKGERILGLGGVSKNVNVYHIDEWYEGVAKNFLNELLDAMKGPKYFNNDDAMTDYFSRSHYTDINIGKWNKPFVLKESK